MPALWDRLASEIAAGGDWRTCSARPRMTGVLLTAQLAGPDGITHT